MSTTIDNRVVEMQFDNAQFERNVSTSLSTLDKLKQRLNLTGAAKGLESVGDAARGINMSPLASGVESVGVKFNALWTIADQTLRNITNSAYNAGTRMVKALTIDPIKTGFSEYETQINAVQTILANTESKGSTLEDVNTALDTLNAYADKTIYNFTEMTRNIGTFTAAGVDLDTSVKSIQGIANLAAISGSTSQQASTAMYQLSQALAAGKISLMDWNSVVNAGMGGQVFQDALKRTATAMGTDVEGMIKTYGSFRESLTKGEWLTADVLTKTLEQFTMAAEEGSAEWEEFKKSLMADGYTAQQAEEILKTAKTATDAATKVKTFTQLIDTLKEAAQSGWTQTWEIIVGDFREAKELLTNISNVVGDFINQMSESRNNLLIGWKEAGGRTDLIEGLSNAFSGLLSVIKPIKEAFDEIIPKIEVKHLTDFTTNFKNFTEKLTLSSDASEKVKRVFKGVFSIFEIGRKIVVGLGKAIGQLVMSDGLGSVASLLLDVAAVIGDFFTSINKGFDSGGLIGVLSGIVNFISDIFGTTVRHIDSFTDLLSAAGDVIANVCGKIWNVVKSVFGWITDTFSAGDIFAGLAGGGIFVAATKLSGFLDNIIDTVKGMFGGGKEKGEGLLDTIKETLGGVQDTLSSFATGIKVSSLVTIAIAVGILSASLKTLSAIDPANTVKSLGAIGSMLGMLSVTMSLMTKTLKANGSKGLIKSGASLILIATAVNILANAIEKVGRLPLADVAKGLLGIGGGLTLLTVSLKTIGKAKVSLSTSVAILVLAESCKILGDALNKFASLSWGEIASGLVAMGGALTELVVAVSVLQKFGGFKSLLGSAAIAILVQSLGDMAEGLKKFGEMSWDAIDRGLTAMGGALIELGTVVTVVGKFAGFSSLLGSAAIFVVIQGLDDLAESLKKFGSMPWGDIARGLVGMGGALLEVAGISGALGKIAGFSAILGSGAILMTISGLDELATAFQKFGSMPWSDVGIGLAAMGGALLEVGAISGALGYLTGIAGIIGAGTIWIAVQGLDELAIAFQKFGSMSWGEIGIGLVAMGGALLEIATISGAMGYLTGIAGLVGAGTIALATQGLDELAVAFQKFGSMSWEQVKNGLAAMGAALGETALGALLNTFSGFGAGAIAEMAGPLGTLADSVKKWEGVTVPEGLGVQMGALAHGVKKFTFGGMGAGALAEVAPGVGQLADGVKKWQGVTVPEGLADELGKLAKGIKKFTFSGMGAGALSSVAPAVGTLAESVKKWEGVKIPEDMNDSLSSVAKGVSSFSYVSDISKTVSSMNDLSGAITKLSGVGYDTAIEGLNNMSDAITNFASDSALNKYRTSFYNAGCHVVNGFTSGISENTFKAEAAARTMAQSALNAAKKALDEHSPSKEFYSVGDFAGLGFVNALFDYVPVANKAGYNVGESARDGLNSAINKISAVINSDVDVQPTIRPVLDLSNIRSGVGSINDMLAIGSSVGVNANVSAISSMMARRGQNGESSEVVSAINKLRKDLGNVGNTSYSIGDITYSSGDEVAQAVETLVRAVRVGGRV